VVGDPNIPELKKYLLSQKLVSISLRPLRFFANKHVGLTENEISELNLFTTRILEKIKDEDSQAELFFNEHFTIVFKEVFSATLEDFKYIQKRLTGTNLKPLFVCSIYNYSSRVLCAAWKSVGGSTTAVSHGNSYLTGIHGQNLNDGTLLICDTFLVASIGEKIQNDYARKNNPTKLIAKTEVLTEESYGVMETYNFNKNLKVVDNIKKIMVVGFPMDYHYYPSLCDHDTLSYAHLTLSILKVLKAAGYYILYKAHPDTISETHGFFDDYVDKVCEENFTDVYHEADCLLYITPFTTTFGFGVLSNIPIVYVNNLNWDLWHKNIKNLLDKRAVPFDVRSDNQGVVRFDTKNLLESINSSINKIEHDVVEKFAFTL
jgi:hypothetical protein